MGVDWTTGPIDLNAYPGSDAYGDERFADGGSTVDLIGNTITAVMGVAATAYETSDKWGPPLKQGLKEVKNYLPGNPWGGHGPNVHENAPKRIEPVRPEDEPFDPYTKAMVPYESTLLPVWGMPVKEAPERFYPPGLPAPPFRKLPPQGPKLPLLQTTKRTGVIPPPAERTVVPPFQPATNQTVPPLDEKDHNITHPTELNFTDAYESSTLDSFGAMPGFPMPRLPRTKRLVKHDQKPVMHEDLGGGGGGGMNPPFRPIAPKRRTGIRLLDDDFSIPDPSPDPDPDPDPDPTPTPTPTPTGGTSTGGGRYTGGSPGGGPGPGPGGESMLICGVWCIAVGYAATLL